MILFHLGHLTNKQLQPTSLLCILAQRVASNSAEPTPGIVTCVYTRPDASVHIVRLLKYEVSHDHDDSQRDSIRDATR